MGVALKARIVDEAKSLGFDAVRFTSADAVAGAGEALDAFLAEHRQGDMFTVRGRCRRGDGKIHTDTASKILTVLLYMVVLFRGPEVFPSPARGVFP